MSERSITQLIREYEQKEKINRLERIILAIAQHTGVALNWETLTDLDDRLKRQDGPSK